VTAHARAWANIIHRWLYPNCAPEGAPQTVPLTAPQTVPVSVPQTVEGNTINILTWSKNQENKRKLESSFASLGQGEKTTAQGGQTTKLNQRGKRLTFCEMKKYIFLLT
jgi:hypothetical protein